MNKKVIAIIVVIVIIVVLAIFLIPKFMFIGEIDKMKSEFEKGELISTYKNEDVANIQIGKLKLKDEVPFNTLKLSTDKIYESSETYKNDVLKISLLDPISGARDDFKTASKNFSIDFEKKTFLDSFINDNDLKRVSTNYNLEKFTKKQILQEDVDINIFTSFDTIKDEYILYKDAEGTKHDNIIKSYFYEVNNAKYAIHLVKISDTEFSYKIRFISDAPYAYMLIDYTKSNNFDLTIEDVLYIVNNVL